LVIFFLSKTGKGRQGGIFKALKYYEILYYVAKSANEEPRRKQRGIKILETRRILSAASCGEYNPK
jgi:hypothetical protein